ncbi:MAG: TadE/TadG family type IV pilus assembly protein [Hyphomicrobiaceae bacterium]
MFTTTFKNWPDARIAQPFVKLARCARGMAAVEFGLIVPLLMVFWLGTNEMGQALMLDRRVTLTASTVADLVAQNATLTEAQVDEMLAVSDDLMQPALMSLYDSNVFKLTIINVTKDSDDNLSVVWAREKDGHGGRQSTEYPVGPINESQIGGGFDKDIVLPSSQQIIAKAEYTFTPAVSHTIKKDFGGSLKLEETFFLAPRMGSVALTPN